MGTIIWDKPTSPTRYVSDRLGIERWQLRQALHEIKARSHLRATDRVIIYDDGNVTDESGIEIGNIHDEV